MTPNHVCVFWFRPRNNCIEKPPLKISSPWNQFESAQCIKLFSNDSTLSFSSTFFAVLSTWGPDLATVLHIIRNTVLLKSQITHNYHNYWLIIKYCSALWENHEYYPTLACALESAFLQKLKRTIKLKHLFRAEQFCAALQFCSIFFESYQGPEVGGWVMHSLLITISSKYIVKGNNFYKTCNSQWIHLL